MALHLIIFVIVQSSFRLRSRPGSLGARHGQDLLSRQFHPMRFFRVSLRSNDKLLFVCSPYDIAARALHRFGHEAPPRAIIVCGSWAYFGAALVNVWSDACTNLPHWPDVYRVREVAAG